MISLLKSKYYLKLNEESLQKSNWKQGVQCEKVAVNLIGVWYATLCDFV